MKRLQVWIIAGVLAAICAGVLHAEIKTSGLISDGMVLQRDAQVKLWGTAAPGEKVTASFRGQSASATAGADGAWLVQIASQGAGGPFPLTLAGTNTISLPNVYVGEVWLLSGQSNMEYALWHCVGGPEAIAASSNPQLRLLTIPHTAAMTPQSDVTVKGGWVGADPVTTKYFSAVGYWFGSKLQAKLGVPVGLINDVWGGTNIEAWVDRDILAHAPESPAVADPDTAKAAYESALAREKPVRDKYEADLAAARAQHLPPPPMPKLTGQLRGPSMMYNGMIVPAKNYTIRGVVWYQGESNSYVGRANSYSYFLPKLIALWRADWAQPDMPFIIPQITPNRKPIADLDPNTPSGIAVVQEAEMLAVKTVPNTALVVSTDLADADGDVHYKRKEPEGERVMRAALALAYGSKEEFSRPIYQAATFADGKATITFTHLGGGLVAKDGPLTGFIIAGADQKFVKADAQMAGDTVVVSSPAVPQPAAVRYGWADNPVPTLNLWNKADLPASPFRTDTWPLPAPTPASNTKTEPETPGVPPTPPAQ
jgi:sialate O-acetylesterase